MTAFGMRSRGYQTGVVLLTVSTILFIIGIVSPMWLVYNREIIQIREERFYAGVLVGCKYNLRKVGAEPYDFTRCTFGFSTAFEQMDDMGGWVHVVETFEILAALALIFACIYAALFNCFTHYPGRRNRILEIVTASAGLTAFIFCMVFVGKLRAQVERNVFYTFSWAFYLSVISSISAMVSALIIALFNEYIPPPSDYLSYSNMNLSGKPGPPSSISYMAQNDALFGTRMSRAGSMSFYNEAERMSRSGSRAGSRTGYDEELDPRIIKAGYLQAAEDRNRSYDSEDREPRTTRTDGYGERSHAGHGRREEERDSRMTKTSHGDRNGGSRYESDL